MMKKVVFTMVVFFAVLTLTTSCGEDAISPAVSENEAIQDVEKADNGSARARGGSSLSIMVMSPNWDVVDHTTCPDETLELNVDGGVGPYTWNIQGATITQMHGDNSVIFVHTASGPETVPLFFKATDANGKTGTITGSTDIQGCYFLCEQYPELSICDEPGGGGGQQQ